MSPRSTIAKLVVLPLCLALATDAAAADSPTESAADLFARGLGAMKREEYGKACSLLAESVQIDSRLGALFTLAECEARAGKLATAWRRFGLYLERAEALSPPQHESQAARIREAKRRRAGLEPDIPLLTIEVPTDLPAGSTIKHNDQRLERSRWGKPIAVDPGQHHVALRVPDGRGAETRVELDPGEHEVVRLAVDASPQPVAPPPLSPSPPPTPAPAPPPPTAGSGAQQVAGWVALGVGASAMVATTVVTILLLDKKGTIDENCDGAFCNEQGFAEAGDVQTLSVVGSVSFGVGVAGLVAGTVLLLTAPEAPSPKDTGWLTLEIGNRDSPLGATLRARW